MAGLIPQTFIDDLIARADIVELIGSRVPLKKAGREYKACCPFHTEKSPSFWVSPDKQFYHCFGCGAHGTALGFLMNYDRLPFVEAVEELASRVGVEVPREASANPGQRGAGDELFELAGRIAKHFGNELARDARVREYVAKRGLTQESVDRFNLGYATASWNDVLKRFGGSDAARQALADIGVIIEREGGAVRDGEKHYDRFRDRLMFPIRDARGRTIAFGGRVIDQGEPKYLNSPETVLFHKGRELYGLYEVRQSRAPLARLLVVEGYVDVVRLHQAGIGYAVATLGTATTPDHLKRIFRLVSEVVFAFDGDRAGRAAAWRALQNALPEAKEGREIRFLFLPDGHDPDTLVAEEGREAFERRLGDAMPLSEYLVREMSADVDLDHADGRARFAEKARPLVAKVPPGVFRELLIARVAETVRLPADRLADLWSASSNQSSSSAFQTRDSREGDAGQATHARRSNARTASRSVGGRRGFVGQAVHVLLHYPGIASRLNPTELDALLPVEEPGMPFLRDFIARLREHPAISTAQVLERWRDRPESDRLAQLAAEELLVPDAAGAEKELRTTLARLAATATERRLAQLLARPLSELSPVEKQELLALQQLGRTPAAPPIGRGVN